MLTLEDSTTFIYLARNTGERLSESEMVDFLSSSGWRTRLCMKLQHWALKVCSVLKSCSGDADCTDCLTKNMQRDTKVWDGGRGQEVIIKLQSIFNFYVCQHSAFFSDDWQIWNSHTFILTALWFPVFLFGFQLWCKGEEEERQWSDGVRSGHQLRL